MKGLIDLSSDELLSFLKSVLRESNSMVAFQLYELHLGTIPPICRVGWKLWI